MITKYSFQIESPYITSFNVLEEGEQKYLRDIFDKTLDLKKKDKIYIYPECKIPRFKLKTILETNECSLTREPSKANKFIFSKADLMTFMSGHYYYSTSKELLLSKLMSGIFYNNSTRANINTELIDCVKAFPEDNLIIDSNAHYRIWGYGDIKGIDYNTLITFEDVTMLQFILNSDFYSDRSLLALTNPESILTNERYETLQLMFDSSDTKDHELAVEMLANFDYELSASNILLLIAKNGNKIWLTKSSRHVNFKGLLTFFKIDNPRYYAERHIIPTLQKLALFSAHHAKRVFDVIINNISKDTSYPGIEAKEFGFDEEALESIRNNKLDPTDSKLYVEEDEDEIKPRL